MKAYIFPGQGAQYPGMGKELSERSSVVRELFARADEILGFGLSSIMFEGSSDDLLATRVTQPAVFLNSYAEFVSSGMDSPDMVAGHSLGEFTALVAAGALSFEDALRLVSIRATAMQRCCEQSPGSMAAIIGADSGLIENICAEISAEAGMGVVLPANFNSTVQTAISGTSEAVSLACDRLKAAGARRAVPLAVGGAFHSPLMMPAREELDRAISSVTFNEPLCPVYQNFTGEPSTDPRVIKERLLDQLTGAVRWTACVMNMRRDGADTFVEFGASTLIGLIRKTLPSLDGVSLVSTLD